MLWGAEWTLIHLATWLKANSPQQHTPHCLFSPTRHEKENGGESKESTEEFGNSVQSFLVGVKGPERMNEEG